MQLPFYESVPQFMDFIVTDHFKGLMVIGGKDKQRPSMIFGQN
jgi:hypothetical protein